MNFENEIEKIKIISMVRCVQVKHSREDVGSILSFKFFFSFFSKNTLFKI